MKTLSFNIYIAPIIKAGLKKTFIFLLISVWFVLPFAGYTQSALSLHITGHDALCNAAANGSAAVAVSGGTAPYQYFWSPIADTIDSVSNLAPGTYTVNVLDAVGLTATASIVISEPTALVVDIDSIVVFPCFLVTGGACGCGNTLWAVVNGGTPPYGYLWTPSGVTTDTLLRACYLEFAVSVTDSNGCMTSDSLLVTEPVRTVPNSVGMPATIATSIVLYPNPASELLNIAFADGATSPGQLEIYDISGVCVNRTYSFNKTQVIDVSAFRAGYYLLRIISPGGVETAHFSVIK